MKKKRDERRETEEYIKFLEKRLVSKNYKANSTKEEYEKSKEALKKAKFRLRILKG